MPAPENNNLKPELNELKTRYERVIEWAEVLQSEFRALKQALRNVENRLTFLETECLPNAEFVSSSEEVLQKRLENIKSHKLYDS